MKTIHLTHEMKMHGNSDQDIIKGILGHKDYEIAQLKADRARLLAALAAVQEKNEELGMALITVRNLLKEIHDCQS